MTTLFDSAGYSSAGVWRRRLWVMALLKLLPSANSGVIKNLDQVMFSMSLFCPCFLLVLSADCWLLSVLDFALVFRRVFGDAGCPFSIPRSPPLSLQHASYQPRGLVRTRRYKKENQTLPALISTLMCGFAFVGNGGVSGLTTAHV